MSDPAPPLQRGDRVSKNWVAINTNGTVLRENADDIRRLREVVARGSRSQYGAERLPFELYLLPQIKRAPADRSDNWWRMFRVRHGYVFAGDAMVSTEGCDDTDDEGVTLEEITVPVTTAAYWIWVEVTMDGVTATAAEIKHGADGWTDFPVASTDATKRFHLLAKIDTATDATKSRSIVRQYQLGDIFLGEGGGDARWS